VCVCIIGGVIRPSSIASFYRGVQWISTYNTLPRNVAIII